VPASAVNKHDYKTIFEVLGNFFQEQAHHLTKKLGDGISIMCSIMIEGNIMNQCYSNEADFPGPDIQAPHPINI
jgi:hypothetical protein